jgi:hypothetical protein
MIVLGMRLFGSFGELETIKYSLTNLLIYLEDILEEFKDMSWKCLLAKKTNLQCLYYE